ncbi:WD40 repeat domain-containing protein [Desulfoplanes formicivorans]|uniref:Uncharacterized protein n=1 Tax=Desulfoplanes formicivorans TaxID=1592317 RepID=A0A194AFV7_9BACT|nr:caspase family protein [Desulfoplanes formicivorans]GAU07966.1 hypothetical protein DPF_0665 [Desulfoplanes formicivorans]
MENGFTRRGAVGMLKLIILFLAVVACLPSVARSQPVPMIVDTGGHTASIRAMDVSRNGRWLVTGSEDKTVRIWDVIQKHCLQMIPMTSPPGLQGTVFALDIAPDDRIVAVGGLMGGQPGDVAMGRVLLLSLPEGTCIATLEHAPSPVHAIAFSPDGRLLAAGSEDGIVRIWDMDQGTLVHSFHGHGGTVGCLAWIDASRLVSGGDDGRILVWGMDELAPIGTLSGHTGRVACLAVSPDGTMLVSGSHDGSVREWDLAAMQHVRQWSLQTASILSLSFRGDGKFVLATTGGLGLGSGRCMIVDPETARVKTLFSGHVQGVNEGLFVPGTSLVATAGEDQTVRLWDTQKGRLVHRFVGRGCRITEVGFGPGGDRIFWKIGPSVLRAPDNTTHAVRPETLEMRFQEGYLDVAAVSLPADVQGPFLNVGTRRLVRNVGADATRSLLEVYDHDQRRFMINRTYEDKREHTAASFTPDGRYVVSGGGRGALAMYRVQDGVKVRDFKGHTGGVTCLAVSPDGTRLVSGSLDQTVRLWNLATGELLATILYATNDEWIAWIPAGYYACSPSGESLLGCLLASENNNNHDILQVVPAETFARYLYQPDLVRATISQGRSAAALDRTALLPVTSEFLSRHRPPGIDLVSPADGAVLGSRQQELLVSLHARGDDPISCRLRVNGFGRDMPQPEAGWSGHLRVPVVLEPGENTVGCVCEGPHGARSSAEIQVHLPEDGNATRKMPGDLYYLGVGVERLGAFAHMDLPTSSDDVKMVARLFTTLRGRGYAKVHERLVSDDYGHPPTRAHIHDALAWLEQAGPRDTIIVMLAGQGVLDQDDRPVFLPRDTRPLGRHGYAWESVVDIDSLLVRLGKLKARTLVLCDVAHTGPLDMTRIMRRARALGVAVLSATRGWQKTAPAYASIPCSPLAYAVFKGIGPGLLADASGDGRVDLDELGAYVTREVQAIDRKLVPSLVVPVGYGQWMVADSGMGSRVTGRD